MSRKPVKVLDKPEIDKLLEGYSRSDWSDALGVTVAALDKWIQRNRIPEEQYSRLLRVREKLSVPGLEKKPLLEIAEAVIREESSSRINDRFQGGIYSKEAAEALRSPSAELNNCVKRLSDFELNHLVDEIESRGWNVSLSRKRQSD